MPERRPLSHKSDLGISRRYAIECLLGLRVLAKRVSEDPSSENHARTVSVGNAVGSHVSPRCIMEPFAPQHMMAPVGGAR